MYQTDPDTDLFQKILMLTEVHVNRCHYLQTKFPPIHDENFQPLPWQTIICLTEPNLSDINDMLSWTFVHFVNMTNNAPNKIFILEIRIFETPLGFINIG